MVQEKQPASSRSKLGPRLADSYALLTGLFGVLVLIRLLDYQTMSFDLSTLLPFTLLALLATYFRVPIGQDNAELKFDGAILLGAMLTAGPVIGGWAAFITGMVSAILPISRKRLARASLVEHIITGALDSGRNVIAIGAAWIAFYWLGGTLKPAQITLMLALTLTLMCLAYVLIRSLLAWPAAFFRHTDTPQTLSQIVGTNSLLLEFIPLPVALLISPAFVQFGWIRLLTLALVLIGTSALMRQMAETIYSLQNQIETTTLANGIKASLHNSNQDTQTLYDLIGRSCTEIAAAQCVLGLYNKAMSQVTVQTFAEGKAISPLIHIPVTPFWAWIGQQQEPILFETRAQFEHLEFALPACKPDQEPQSALLLPILLKPAPVTESADETLHEIHPVGALVLESSLPHAFDKPVVERILTLTDLLGEAIQRINALSTHSMQDVERQIARQIQSDLLPQRTPAVEGWDIAFDWELSSQARGMWADLFHLPDKDKFVLVEPHTQGLPAFLTATLVQALIRSNDAKGPLSESEALEAMNAYLIATNQATSLLYVTLDREQILTLINAGCAEPLWWHSEHQRVEVLRSEGGPLGLAVDVVCEEKSIALAPNDTLVLYTNSLLDISNGQESFGQQRAIQAINQLAGCSASELAAAIIAQASAFCAPSPLPDDVLLAVFCRKEILSENEAPVSEPSQEG